MKQNNLFLIKKTKIKIFLKYQILMFFVSLVLYHNFILSYFFSYSFLFVYKKLLVNENNKIKNNIIIQFKEFLNLFNVAIVTGDEPVKAFILAYDEYKTEDKDDIFLNELSKVYNHIKIYNDFVGGIQLLKNNLDIDVINKFYDSINVAYKSYGNLNEILINTIDLINEKITIENEIENLFHEKKYEMKIMLAVPILIYLFLSFTAKEFLEPIYNNTIGYFVLTACLMLLILAYFLGEKILENDFE